MISINRAPTPTLTLRIASMQVLNLDYPCTSYLSIHETITTFHCQRVQSALESIQGPRLTTKMLTTTRPTPTTVSYTVSTRSQRGTLTSRLTTLLTLTLRLTAVLLILHALLLEFQLLSTGTAYALPAWLSTQSLPLGGGRHHHPPASESGPGLGPGLKSAEIPLTLALPFPPLIRASAYALILWLAFRKGYTSESLLVIRGLGVQTATAGTSFLWGGSTRFIAASAVQDIFIHEAFRGFEVRFYLCIVVEGEEGVVVVFPVSLIMFFVLELLLLLLLLFGRV